MIFVVLILAILISITIGSFAVVIVLFMIKCFLTIIVFIEKTKKQIILKFQKDMATKSSEEVFLQSKESDDFLKNILKK